MCGWIELGTYNVMIPMYVPWLDGTYRNIYLGICIGEENAHGHETDSEMSQSPQQATQLCHRTLFSFVFFIHFQPNITLHSLSTFLSHAYPCYVFLLLCPLHSQTDDKNPI